MNIIKMEFDLNGTVVDDIQSWKDGAVTYGKTVKFVAKTSYAPMTPRYSFQIKYAQPQKARVDFTAVIYEEGMTFTVYLDGGETIVYRDIHLNDVRRVRRW